MNAKPLKDFTCAMCGAAFQSVANHAQYCEACRHQKQLERARAYTARKELGENPNARGTTRICKTCGKEFSIKSAAQVYCSDACKPKRKTTSEQVVESRRKNYDTFTFYMPKGCRAFVMQAAEKLNFPSTSDVLREALMDYMEKNTPEIAKAMLHSLPSD